MGHPLCPVLGKSLCPARVWERATHNASWVHVCVCVGGNPLLPMMHCTGHLLLGLKRGTIARLLPTVHWAGSSREKGVTHNALHLARLGNYPQGCGAED